MQERDEIVEILLVDRPVEAELPEQFGVAFRRHAALAGHQQDRIARQDADEGKRGNGHTEKRRYDQPNSP